MDIVTSVHENARLIATATYVVATLVKLRGNYHPTSVEDSYPHFHMYRGIYIFPSRMDVVLLAASHSVV